MNNAIQKNTILIATGGTGGHIFPSLSIINQIQNHLFIIITDERGKNYFNNSFINKEINFKIFTHRVSSPSNKFLINKLKSFIQFFISTFQSILLILNYKPDAVIGFGGYPSVAPILAAKIFNIPSIIHEQNTVIGRANKLLCKICDVLALSFSKTKNLPNIKKSIYTGNPVRKEFYEIGKNKYLLPNKKRKYFYILIYGGSLGSSFLSEHLTSIICSLPQDMKKKIKIIQQVRKEEIEYVRESYKINKIDSEISSFFEDISIKFKIAHLIITRSGGSSVAEILASNRPVIFIPLPTALDNHQYENARFIESNKGGWLISQTKNISELENLIKNILLNPNKLVEASNQTKKLSNKLKKLRDNKTPAEFLCEYILKIKNNNKKVVSTIC